MKNNFIFRHIIIALIVVAVLVAGDQITKFLARTYLEKGSIVLIPGVFELLLVENEGMAFSMFSGQMWLFYILTPIISLLIIYLYLKLPDKMRYYPLRVCFEFLLAGAIGNYIDRLYKQSVTDFLYFSLIKFPVFNVADIYVTCSMAVLIVLLMFKYSNEELEKWIGRKE
ncbi:MAG: signal peptidase II [Lachnospiraceae bacterium]|nr:signal peptidase II [Lachnospiraceae bacterium]